MKARQGALQKIQEAIVMEKAKRLVVLLLCLALIMTLPVAGMADGTGDSNLNEPGTFPICKETVQFSIGIPKSTTVLDWDTNFMTESLEADVNCEFEFIEMGADNSEMKQKVELQVMAGGADLPDILIYTPGDASANYYGQLGTFIALDEYMDDAYYYPQAVESIPYDPLVYARSADGHLYGLFAIEYAMETAIYIRLYTNMDFLEALDMELPTSCQEFEDMLRAIKTQDPNGNGKNDEVGFMTSKNRLWNHFVMPLMTPFVYSVGQDGNNYLSFDENGKIQASYATEGWHEGLTWIAGMVSEGLISPLCFTQDDEQVKTFANSAENGEQLIGVSTYYPVNWYPTGDERATNWGCIRCLEGFDGKRTAPFSYRMPTLNYFITKNCENPEAAFRLGDLLTGEKYTLMTRYGEENVDWVHAEPSDESYYEGYDALYIPVLAWAIPNNKRWDNGSPYIRNAVISNGVAVKGKMSGLDAWANEMASESLPYVDYSKVVGKIVYNEEELDEITEIQSNIETYYKECFSRFAVGDMSLENDWQSYLDELDAIGLERYIEISQQAYDRMHAES